MADPADFWARDDQVDVWTRALTLFQEGYDLQSQGLWADAMARYRASIHLYPTPEAHTFLGWVYSFLKLYDEAIRECHRAIELDPEFGNPYNDIGAYLVELGRDDEAVVWFEKALRVARYDARCFPHYNLGRIHERRGEWPQAMDRFRRALEENPSYEIARNRHSSLLACLN